MQFSILASLAVLPALVLSVPTPQAQGAPAQPSSSSSASNAFTLTAVDPKGDPTINGQPINAAAEGFWIGRDTETYCDSTAGIDCDTYDSATTSIAVGAVNQETSAGMNAAVPGGQQMFVGEDGAWGYTQPHSMSTEGGGDNATTVGFMVITADPKSSATASFGFVGAGACNVYACRDGPAGTFRIFSDVAQTPGEPGGKTPELRGCTAIDVEASPYKGVGAWEFE